MGVEPWTHPSRRLEDGHCFNMAAPAELYSILAFVSPLRFACPTPGEYLVLFSPFFQRIDRLSIVSTLYQVTPSRTQACSQGPFPFHLRPLDPALRESSLSVPLSGQVT